VGTDSTFSKGDRVDRFEIHELIGQGGMGAIYRAVDTRLGRTVALKVVRADRMDSSSGDQARQRFLREALAISKVDHRNVVRVLDFGFSGDTPYLAMEFLRGRDLGQLVKTTSGALPIAEVIDVMLGVCAAIRACHESGIIHRDLKPSNVFLCESDGAQLVKILDFGVSKTAVAGELTREGQIVGTPQYLAPEQIDGVAVPQTDQYAIGVMLYLCLTKTLPYQNLTTAGLLRAIAVGKFPPPRALRAELPEKLDGIILRAMRADPEERFESVFSLGRELWEFASSDAREQWRSYYLDDRVKAAPKASAHAMPLIEALARGIAGVEPVRDADALASTATAAPRAVEKPARAVPEKPVPTVLEKPAPGARPAPAPPEPTGGQKRPGRVKSWRTTWIATGVATLAVAGWLTFARLRRPDPPEAVAPAPAQRASPRSRPQEPAEKVPSAPPVPAAASAPAAASPTSAPSSTPARERPAPKQPAHVEKRHRRNNRGSPAEQPSDAVPIMP
jgi:tRNA A-37 threonylcarbamoyl transferase component Bud32